ncbi:MAG TPA: cysteine peptidase family C39 domain-containing protein [Planctomycetaceae bacterium]|nr:cysteine peptidase family C39 domain-containing protein [Planctomycetaceae bacterium]HQZ65359.1 cysteine peptidase family C39 domain-containing protein [Planctomycetaceae bacterium]
MSERLLIRYPLFELLDVRVLHALLDDAVSVEFETGEVLFQEGTTGAWVHLLVEGRVRILRRAESGRDISLGTVQAGELFGEYVLLAPHQHTATCRASSHCVVLKLPVRKIRAALETAGIDSSLLKPLIRLHASMHFLTGRHYLGFMSAPSALTYDGLLKPEHFRGMRTLCGPGLAKDRWFYITAGTAILSDKHGRCLELSPGDCFGSLCLAGRDADETVSTLSELQCLSLRVPDFIDSSIIDSNRDRDRSSEDSQQTRLTRHISPSRFPFFAQHHESDCGLAAFVMISQFLGISAKDTIYQNTANLDQNGLSLLHLRDLARSLLFSAEAYRIDPEHLTDLQCPFIAHLNGGHFIVVYHADDCSVLIADPATSLHSVSEEKLKEIWSGYALLVRRHSREVEGVRSS